MNEENIRSYCIGSSDYPNHRNQPWDLWEYIFDGWRCDIIKRLLRTKEGNTRLMDYQKIRHIILKILDLLDKGFRFFPNHPVPEELLASVMEEYNLKHDECLILSKIMEEDTNDPKPVRQCLVLIDRLIADEQVREDRSGSDNQ